MSDSVHASCVAIDGHAVLLFGPSGAGKSDLALRLIDRGARLVSDDYTRLAAIEGRLVATAPATIAGRIEVRGIGIVEMPALAQAPVLLAIDLADAPERLPPDPLPTRDILGIPLPLLALSPLEASAPIKVELAVRRLMSENR
jgi:serine kinase of HPr protein (carbohydrate metabolism regulator)